MEIPKWQITTVIAPATDTVAETFVWYRPIDRLQIGAALLWKQGAFRGLANYQLVKETVSQPSIRVGFGLQGIGTGNPGYFATMEKSLFLKEGGITAYAGVGFRTNEDHAHGLGGVKFSPADTPWTLGVQFDGHWAHPFATYRLKDGWSVGAYLVESRTPGLMISWAK
ncbi:MAG TPA: hypothetical protein VJ835_09830 [Fimbriimonadaceae bacterium]|nr:hypothetical protein [Fimbriimonadaceae bacterium]